MPRTGVFSLGKVECYHWSQDDEKKLVVAAKDHGFNIPAMLLEAERASYFGMDARCFEDPVLFEEKVQMLHDDPDKIACSETKNAFLELPEPTWCTREERTYFIQKWLRTTEEEESKLGGGNRAKKTTREGKRKRKPTTYMTASAAQPAKQQLDMSIVNRRLASAATQVTDLTSQTQVTRATQETVRSTETSVSKAASQKRTPSDFGSQKMAASDFGSIRGRTYPPIGRPFVATFGRGICHVCGCYIERGHLIHNVGGTTKAVWTHYSCVD